MCEKCPADPARHYAGCEIPAFSDLMLRARTNAFLLFNSGSVAAVGGDRFEVRDADRVRVKLVRWRNGKWTCNSCSGSRTSGRPCSHMVAVFLHLGLMVADSSPASSGVERNPAAIDAGKRNMAEAFPKLAAQLCDTVRFTRFNQVGREPVAARDLMYGALRYVEMNRCLRETESQLKLDFAAGHLRKMFSYPLISQYLNHAGTAAEIDRLLLTVFIATSHFARSAGMDGTGFQRRNYYEYADDRARQRAKAEEAPPSKSRPLLPYERRRRGYVQAIPLIIYETNIVPAVMCRVRETTEGGGQFDGSSRYDPDYLDGLGGEQPYFLALLERVRPYFPHLETVRADMGFFKLTHYQWGEHWGVRVSIPFKSNYNPHSKNHSGSASRAAARAYNAWHADPTGSLAEYHKRSHDEGMMNGVKVEFGGGVQTRKNESQCNEVRLKWLAFSLKQVIYLMHKHEGWVPDFQAAAERLGLGDLAPLRDLALRYKDVKWAMTSIAHDDEARATGSTR